MAVNKQLFNSVLAGYEELLRQRFVLSASADNTNRGLNNSSYPARTEFNNCFIIFWKYFKLSLNACFVSKKTQAANINGTAWNCSKTLISQSDYGKIFSIQLSDYDGRSINKGQSIYDEMSHIMSYICLQYTTKWVIMSYIYFQLQIWATSKRIWRFHL